MATLLNDTQFLQANVRINTIASMRDLLSRMIGTYEIIMSSVWNNSDGLTPQQVLDGFGNNAGELFQLAGLCANTIITAAPGTTLSQPTKTFTINPDGTVTVTS